MWEMRWIERCPVVMLHCWEDVETALCLLFCGRSEVWEFLLYPLVQRSCMLVLPASTGQFVMWAELMVLRVSSAWMVFEVDSSSRTCSEGWEGGGKLVGRRRAEKERTETSPRRKYSAVSQQPVDQKNSSDFHQ